MKKSILFLFAIISIAISCDKAENSIVDCTGQSLFIDIDHTVSSENALQVNFNVHYSGTSHTLDNTVKWDFGDGTPLQTLSGTTASHTYSTVGHYTAKVKVSLNNGSCSFEPHESINLE